LRRRYRRCRHQKPLLVHAVDGKKARSHVSSSLTSSLHGQAGCALVEDQSPQL
jgi:hypothetical protein